VILVVDDDVAIRTSLSLLLKQAGYAARAVSDPASALRVVSETPPELALIDMNYSLDTSGQDGLLLLSKLKKLCPALPVILITGWGSIGLAVEGMKGGAAEFVTKPWNNDALLQTIRTVLDLQTAGVVPTSAPPQPAPVAAPIAPVTAADSSGSPIASPAAPTLLSEDPTRRQLDQQHDFAAIVGHDPKLLSVLRSIGQVAATDASVLIEGESGTGKELIAEALHRNSRRRRAPFVKVNLGGVSSSLFESEMFGHRKGAFTDAKTDRVGRFELANGGTIFLDEIGELEMASQVKLLRVLQDRTYEALGDSKSRSLDIRVVCATNRNLAQMVAEGKFREDLFYRINLITVRLPALRERADDIPRLVEHFVKNLRATYQRPALRVGTRALHWLKERPLPGNIRELKNLVERAVLVSGKDELAPEDFQAHVAATPTRAAPSTELPVGEMTLDEVEAAMIRRSLDLYAGNLSRVARALGLSRGALYRRLEKHGIPYQAES
jgi:two-component system, NtrC family, response regulator